MDSPIEVVSKRCIITCEKLFLDFGTILRRRFVAKLRMFAVLGGPTTAGFFLFVCLFFFVHTKCWSARQECSDPVVRNQSVCVLGGATGPTLETDSSFHISGIIFTLNHLCLKKKKNQKQTNTHKNCSLVKETAPHSLLTFKTAQKLEFL